MFLGTNDSYAALLEALLGTLELLEMIVTG
jgi:hypothetical protein